MLDFQHDNNIMPGRLPEVTVVGDNAILDGQPMQIDQSNAKAKRLWHFLTKAIQYNERAEQRQRAAKQHRRIGRPKSNRLKVCLDRNVRQGRRYAVEKLIDLALGGKRTSGTLKMKIRFGVNKVSIKRPPGDGSFTCAVCGQKFTKEGYYERHVMTMHNPARRRVHEEDTVTTPPKRQSVKSTSPELEEAPTEETELIEEEEKASSETVKEESHDDELIESEEQQDDTEADAKSELVDDDTKTPEEGALSEEAPSKTGMKCKHCGRVFANRGALGSHVRRTHRRRPARLTMTPKRKTVESSATTSHDDIKKENDQGDADEEKPLPVINDALSSSTTASRSTTHECATCGALLTTEKAMIQHGLEEHNDSRPFKCRHCDSKYSNVAHRLRHERTSHGMHNGEPISATTCALCNDNFESENELRKHALEAHDDTHPFKCTLCDATFTTHTNIEHHIRIRHNQRGIETRQIANYERKRESSQIPSDSPPAKLERSSDGESRRYDSIRKTIALAKQEEIRSPEKPFGAAASDKLPSRVSFVCTRCDERFTTEVLFVQHCARMHAVEKPFECDICEQIGFSTSYARLRHEKIVHPVPSPQTTFYCRTCGELFVGEEKLRSHYSLVHDSDRAFKCLVCEADFSNNWGKLRHERAVHCNERLAQIERQAYQCRLCPVKCTTEPQLIKHFRADHEGERPFRCRKCDAAFLHNYRRRQHEVRMHEAFGDRSSNGFGGSGVAGYVPRTVDTNGHITDAQQRTALMANTASSGSKYECDTCDTRFPNEIMYTQHMEREHNDPRPFKCRTCQSSFPNNWGLLRHNRQVHPPQRPATSGGHAPVTAKRVLPSSHTTHDTSNAVSAEERRAQIQRQGLLYRCRKCPQKFAYESSLRKHFQDVHGSMRAFACNKCQMTFIHEYKRRQHERYCGNDVSGSALSASKATSSSIGSTGRRYHGGGGARVYQGSPFDENREPPTPFAARAYDCETCGQRCESEKLYLEHCMKKHNNPTPFKCRQCDVRFKYNYSRTKHERRHVEGKQNDSPQPVPLRRFASDDVDLEPSLLVTSSTFHTNQDDEFTDSGEVVASSIPTTSVENRQNDEIQLGLQYQCIACNASFHTEPELLQHVVVHE